MTYGVLLVYRYGMEMVITIMIEFILISFYAEWCS